MRTKFLRSVSIAIMCGASACSTGSLQSGETATVAPPVPSSATASSTASGLGSSNAAPHASVEALRKALHAHYSYRDRLGIDWNLAIDERAQELAAAPDARAFAKIASEILAGAKDPHVTLAVEGQSQRLVPYLPQPVLNVALPTLQRVIKDWNVRTKCLVTGRFDGYAYVLITHWDRARCGAELGADVAKALSDAADAKGLILDMRGNTGGDEMLARAVAGRFVKKPTLHSPSVLHQPTFHCQNQRKPRSFACSVRE